jgi:peptidase M28-like protein
VPVAVPETPVNPPCVHPGHDLGAIGLAALAAVFSVLATLALEREPAPAPIQADPRTFSAERANAFRQEVLSSGEPHPVGSAANDAVRERILRAFELQGYSPIVESQWACGAYGGCARTHNIIATFPGTTDAAPVVVAAHYDSVSAGAGASDDGAGVAVVLELARAVRQGLPLVKPIRFLMTDGEEAGLLGAQAYVSHHQEDAGAIVNVEARGTHGLAMLFETGPNNGAVIDLVAAHVSRPKSTSLFEEVYRVMPNDTDFSVLRRGETMGTNLALIGGASQYHTRLDDLAHGSVGSLQHEGETALSVAVAFASGAGDPPRPGLRDRLVWFDLGSRILIRWPARYSAPIAASMLCLLLAMMVFARSLWNPRSFLRAFLMAIGALIVSLVMATAIGAVLFLAGRAPAPWIAHPWPAFGAALAAAAASTLGMGGIGTGADATGDAQDRPGPASFWAAWLLWAIVGLATSLALPGVSYLFVPPVVMSVVAAMACLTEQRARRFQLWMLAPFTIVAIEWASVFLLVPTALGLIALPIYGLLGGLCTLPLVPLLPAARRVQRRLVVGLLAMGLTFLVVSCALPTFVHDRPQRLNVLYLVDDRVGPRWLLESTWAGFRYSSPPSAMLQAGGFAPKPVAAMPFRADAMHAAPAPDVGLPSPELSVVARQDQGGLARRVRVRLRSPRGASQITLAMPPSTPLAEATVEGARMPLQSPTVRRFVFNEWKVISVMGLPPEGAELELGLNTGDLIEAVLVDRSAGLPPQGQAIESARPDWSQQSQDGDGTLVLTHVRL